MSQQLADLLDLKVAWQRVRADIPHRVFVQDPFELAVVEYDVVGWLEGLLLDIRQGRYHQNPMIVCEVPKGNGAIRPGAHLHINDRIVYAGCVGACYPYIHQALSWSQSVVDFSYVLSDEPDAVEWIKHQFVGWNQFREATLALAGDGASHVLFTDLTAYYDNVDICTLMSDLRRTGAPEPVVLQLSTCLNRWAESPGRGIPQGHAPSDILGKLYLNSIDDNLKALGYRHLRYVDDFRVFCRSEREAKKALIDLTRLLRKRGLSLQTKKTELLGIDDVKRREESVIQTLHQVRQDFISQMQALLDSADTYVSWDELDQFLEESNRRPEETPIAVIREAYKAFFLPTIDDLFGLDEANQHPFDKTLFHFLLNRLGKASDDYACEHCITLLSAHPEETKAICQYLHRIGKIAASDRTIAAYLTSQDAIYPYQVYQLVECRLGDDTPPIPELLSLVRKLAFDGAQPSYVRSVSRKFLGAFGSPGDLERLEYSYCEARGEWEQCEILCSLKNVELRRRNTFLGRVEKDSPLHGRVVAMVKANRV